MNLHLDVDIGLGHCVHSNHKVEGSDSWKAQQIIFESFDNVNVLLCLAILVCELLSFDRYGSARWTI